MFIFSVNLSSENHGERYRCSNMESKHGQSSTLAGTVSLKRALLCGIVAVVVVAVVVGVAVGVPLSKNNNPVSEPIAYPEGSTVVPGSSLYKAIQILNHYPLVDG